MKIFVKAFLFIAFAAPFANAGLTVQDNLSEVFGAVGNFSGATVSGTISGDAGTTAIVGDGDVVRIIGAIEYIADPTGPTTGSPGMTSYAALVYASKLATGEGNLTSGASKTFTGATSVWSSDLSNLMSGTPAYSTTAAAYLLTSDTYDFASASTFSDLNTAAGVTSNAIQVAAAYDLSSDYAVSGIVFSGNALLNYKFALNETYIDSTATGFFGTVDSSGNEIIVNSQNSFNMEVVGQSWDFTDVPHTLSGLNHLQVNAVPEPSSLAALASLGLVGLLYRRRN